MAVQGLTDSTLAATTIRGGCDVSKAHTGQTDKHQELSGRQVRSCGLEGRRETCGRVDLPWGWRMSRRQTAGQWRGGQRTGTGLGQQNQKHSLGLCDEWPMPHV